MTLRPAPRARVRGAAMALAVAAASAGAHLVLGLGFIRSAAPTFDEPAHLASGYSYWRTGRYRLNVMDHPPLAEMAAAAPLLRLRPRLLEEDPDWVGGRLYHYADSFLYRNAVPAETMLNSARIFSLCLWTALLAGALFAWAWRLGGPPVAGGTAVAFAFCPAMISHLSLATTDASAATWFFWTAWILGSIHAGASASLSAGASAPLSAGGNLGRWAAAGACLGLALASKFSMVLLAPLAAFLVGVERVLERPARPRPPWAGLAVFFLCGLACLAACYRFAHLPLWWEGLAATWRRLGEGRGAFLLGRHSSSGFLLYFPVALAVKTPLATLAAAAAGLAFVLRPGFPARERLWLLAPPSVFFAAAMAAKVHIGYRHILPVVPFLLVLAGCGAAWLWERGWGRPAALALGVWLAASVLRVHPLHLAYFNELAGGPGGGYKVLVDSNLDWGQGLKGLARELDALGGPPVYLSYFGTADPSAYGIRYVPTAFVSAVERDGDRIVPAASGRVLVAVSATNLQGTYFRDPGLFEWLKSRTPLRVADHSIFLYDLTGDAEACRRLAEVLKLSNRPGDARALLLSLKK